MAKSTRRSLDAFNAISAVGYAAAALAWRQFEGRPLADHLTRLVEGQWGLAEAALMAAALSGVLAGRMLAWWFELHDVRLGRGKWWGASLRGAVVGAAAVVVACVLTGESALVTGTTSGLLSQELSWRSAGNVALLPVAIVVAAPMFVLLSLSVSAPTLLVAVPGGALNGVVNLWVSRRAQKRWLTSA